MSLEEPDRVPIAMRRMELLEHLWKDRAVLSFAPQARSIFDELAGLGGKTWDGVPEESRSYRNLMVLFEARLEYGRYPLRVLAR